MQSENKTVVRLTKDYYKDGVGVACKVKLRTLKRLSCGYDLVGDQFQAEPAIELPRVINLFDVKEGVYTLEIVNLQFCLISGYLDEWDYKLVPFKGEVKPKSEFSPLTLKCTS